MEIGNLGSARMNALNPGTENARAARLASSGGSVASFEEILRRASPGGISDLADTATDAVMRNGPSGMRIDKDSELYKQCLELEMFVVKNLVSSMRSTIQKAGLMEQGFAGDIYEDMLFDEYTRKLTENSGFGMAEQAYLQMSGVHERG